MESANRSRDGGLAAGLVVATLVAIGGASGVGWLTGCAPTPPASFRSADPASRLRAIDAAVHAQDRSAIPDLIESLDSADPAVRMMALHALVTLTGEDCGYRVGDPPELRAEAMERWIDLARREGWVREEPPA